MPHRLYIKILKALLLICCCFSGISAIAQTSAKIQSDLLASLDKINQFRRPGLDPQDTTSNYDVDSLNIADSLFVNKLKKYNNKFPLILPQVIKKIGGAVSEDNLLWIYSWDNGLGGTWHIFENVIRYLSGKKSVLVEDALADGKNYVYYYDKLYTLNIQGKKFYLSTYYGIFDLYSRGEGIRIFSIENGKLNTRVNLIKTKSGLTCKLYYSYNQTDNNLDIMGDPTIVYDPEMHTITFPVVNDQGQITENFITYKFTGKYFEKVKN